MRRNVRRRSLFAGRQSSMPPLGRKPSKRAAAAHSRMRHNGLRLSQPVRIGKKGSRSFFSSKKMSEPHERLISPCYPIVAFIVRLLYFTISIFTFISMSISLIYMHIYIIHTITVLYLGYLSLYIGHTVFTRTVANGWTTSSEHTSTPRPPEGNGNPCYAFGKRN